jgi:hypothetical protein
MTGGRHDRSGWGEQLDRQTAARLEWARWAVERWSAFPANQNPRPLVLVESRVRVEKGFTTGPAKLAFVEGRVESTVELPERVIEALRLRDHPARSLGGEPLMIHAAALEEIEFMTDRGPQRLPAWRLSAQDALGAILVLDPDVADWKPATDAAPSRPQVQGPGHRGGMPVEVGEDDRSMLAHWLGGAPSCERYPTAEVVESSKAVAVVPVGEDLGPPGPRTAVGHVHRVPGVLREPLGARVLIDLNGNPQQAIRQTDSLHRAT